MKKMTQEDTKTNFFHYFFFLFVFVLGEYPPSPQPTFVVQVFCKF